MGMTMIEKILARKAGLASVSVGDIVVVDVDMTVLIDMQFGTQWKRPNRIHDPDKLAVVMDHAVPAPTIRDGCGWACGPQVRRRLRHRTLLRRRPTRYLPPGDRRERAGAARRGTGLHRFSHLRGGCLQHRRSRFGTGRRSLFNHVYRQDLFPDRPDHPL